MIRDRGHIKWTSLMLPEHKKMLARFYYEQDDIQQPVLDEQKLEEFNQTINEAMSEGRAVKLDFFRNNRMETFIGTILKCDVHLNNIQVEGKESRYQIPFDKIINISLFYR